MFVSLLKFRMAKDRTPVHCLCDQIVLKFNLSVDIERIPTNPDYPAQHLVECPVHGANLISSRLLNGRHKPVLDMDFPHRYSPSTKLGHGHLYLDVELPYWRWLVLMIGLRVGGVIEGGFFWWSLRRGGNFVRPQGVRKTPDEQIRAEAPPRYGMFRRIK